MLKAWRDVAKNIEKNPCPWHNGIFLFRENLFFFHLDRDEGTLCRSLNAASSFCENLLLLPFQP